MKFLLNTFLSIFILASCNSQKSDAVKQAKEVQSAVQENRPGAIAITEGGWSMTAKLNGKDWKASSIMPPDAAGRIIGYYNKDYIGLPYDKRDMVVGKKNKLGEDNAVDLSMQDYPGLLSTNAGEMEITKVNDNWAEGTFRFRTKSSDKTIEVTDGFFRISLAEKH